MDRQQQQQQQQQTTVKAIADVSQTAKTRNHSHK
jgi:hypothetical protein